MFFKVEQDIFYRIMTGISTTVLVLAAIVLVKGEIQTFRQNEPSFMTGIARRSVKERLSVQPPPMPGFNLNAVCYIL
jgi:hypothetical protein